ncbi:hypothetical protein VCRA2110O2_30316 [Vibrio crassostreae]|nr:hypothetical protein VCHA44O286_50061 [Vibrio chagasii]CAK2872872.1 hypothetical protein VCRA2110O2_30316 [Vibrio crassostreae]
MSLKDKEKLQIKSIINAIHESVILDEWVDVHSFLYMLLTTPSEMEVFTIRAYLASHCEDYGFHFCKNDGWYYSDRQVITVEFTEDNADAVADENVIAWQQQIIIDKPEHIKFATHSQFAAICDLHFTGAVLIKKVQIDDTDHDWTLNNAFGHRVRWPKNFADKLALLMKDVMCGPGHEVDHSELPVTDLVYSEIDSDATPDRELDAWFERITADDSHPATITVATDLQFNRIRVEDRFGRMRLGHLEYKGKTYHFTQNGHLDVWPEGLWSLGTYFVGKKASVNCFFNELVTKLNPEEAQAQ